MRDQSAIEQTAAAELFPVIEMEVFRRRYPPEVLRTRALGTQRIARRLRQRLGQRSILGVAFYPWHDQTTLWWFEQGMLTLLAATGWQTVWVTDARYTFDFDRLAELDAKISIVRHPSGSPWEPPRGPFDAVVALFPNDHATRAARELGAKLVTFAIKNLHQDEPTLLESPPPGTPLWHAFAGSINFVNGAVGPRGVLGATGAAWRLVGAPFPANRYYFPVRQTQPVFDALLFGSNARDYHTAFAALARAGAGRVAALVNTEDAGRVSDSARRHRLDVEVMQPMSHVRLLELLEQTRLVINPIMPPAESHYSLSIPLALGRPIVATDLPSVRPFAGTGVVLARPGDVESWTRCICALLAQTADSLPHRGALKQSREYHDLDTFFSTAFLSAMDANGFWRIERRP